MTARYRSTIFPRVSGRTGFVWQGVDLSNGPSVNTDFSSCNDFRLQGDCSPFVVERLSTSGGVINKPGANYFDSWFHNYVADVLRNGSNFTHLSISSPSDIEAATKGAARTNPSRAYVDMPVDLFDFRPKLESMRQRAIALRGRPIRRLGHTNLEYHFTVAPLVGDLVKLWYAQEQISRRVQEIQRLYNGTGLRRTVDIGLYSARSVVNLYAQSSGALIYVPFDVNTLQGLRVHCRWRPTTLPGLRPAPDQMRMWAVRSVLGLTVDSSTLWELVPWSWLLDWFGNVGEYFSSQRNIVPAILTDVNPMRHTKTTWTCGPVQWSNGLTMTSIAVLRETKSRVLSSVLPTAHIGFLSGKQIGLLASLLATR